MDVTKVMARRSDWKERVEIVLAWKGDGRTAVALPIQFSLIGPSEPIQEPTVELDFHAAQQLIDALWDCGLRPTEGTGSAGALAATERHLKDMQTIAFRLLPNT